MKIKKSDWLAISIFIVIFQILCCWCVDVSVSALINQPDIILTNGWNIVNPMLTYHIGIYGIVITTCLTILILLHIILKEKKE